MKNHPHILLKSYLNKDDIKAIKTLEQLCKEHDKTSLKLELEYKASISAGADPRLDEISEIMYFEDDSLVGYLGIGNFGSFEPELNGMVHPDYRRKGIFKRLYAQATYECSKTPQPHMLLLTDRDSVSGSTFVKNTGARLHHSEFEMYLDKKTLDQLPAIEPVITLRKASNQDTDEIARQNAVYFGCPIDEVQRLIPEEEEANGMTIFIAECGSTVVGKVHLALYDGVGSIYGLGILEAYRGKGYGKQLLRLGVQELLAKKASDVFLQVEAQNDNALQLYISSGFYVTSTMDYYLK
ncbi:MULTISPECIES: GNAT family N-acetyltransferase [unclassified Fusibacter]|uniref:GNAT family N-acetyltransferase n=1 Tax=unclassified Fusibacter TaxID=2624464 RepID=UPI00101025C7|nr:MULTISPECIES: GNAT family N-acetyltransferase [unclassified Fusibacter]MCK8060630.1 GNAT family N-acetyltransferase [Fusibacter sp. A2]NPE22916.1 GNAT family N-acetyltransferase [Fusibacter sp. A1]RXV59983.1 GNAT family N-acetyltransferase [Fusibacter sp. A1]